MMYKKAVKAIVKMLERQDYEVIDWNFNEDCPINIVAKDFDTLHFVGVTVCHYEFNDDKMILDRSKTERQALLWLVENWKDEVSITFDSISLIPVEATCHTTNNAMVRFHHDVLKEME